MKILRLDLRAFGPFTDVTLDLSEGREGLHLIYGPNEAGKSSSLRALRQMLFGIDLRTPENFVHKYENLRVGATLRHHDGSELAFLRRKGTKKVLLDPEDGSELDDSALGRFLGAMDESRFSTLYAIDHEALTRAGREIAQGDGHLGQLVFGAGTDLARLRRLQRSLESQGGDLYKPSGKNPPLNKALVDFAEAKRALDAASLRSTDWVERREALADAHRRKAECAARLDEAQRVRSRLERIEQALPDIAQRRDLLAESERLADVPLLRDEFSADRVRDEKAHQAARIAEQAAQTEIDRIDRELSDLVVPEAPLAHAEEIEALQRRLGVHQAALEETDTLRARLADQQARARAILRALGRDEDLDSAGSLRVHVPEQARLRNLAAERPALEQECKGLIATIERLNADVGRIDAALADLPPPRDAAPLGQVIARVQEQALLSRHSAARDELARRERSAKVALGKLTLWSGSLDDLSALVVPDAETIERFRDELDAATTALKSAEDLTSAQSKQLREIDRQLRRQDLEGELPSEQDLNSARALRDRGWDLIRGEWCEGKADPGAVEAFLAEAGHDGGLAGAYERAVTQSDGVADRLRREASRVVERARLIAEREDALRKLEDDRAALDRARSDLEATRRRWAELWAPLGIEPLPPKEMLAWHRHYLDLDAMAAAIGESRDRVRDLERELDEQRDDLSRALAKLGEPTGRPDESLADRLGRARDVVTRIDRAEAERRGGERELSQHRAELARARQEEGDALRRWSALKSAWAEAMGRLGLPADASNDEANAVLDRREELARAIDAAERLRERIEALDRERDRLVDDLRALALRVEPTLADAPPARAIPALNELLKDTERRRASRDDLRRRRDRLAKQAKEARAAVAENRAALDALCREARCANPSELPAVEQRSSERRRVEKDLRDVEARLRKLSGGSALPDFLAEAGAHDPDALRAEIARLEESIRSGTTEKEEIDQAIGREEMALKQMDETAREALAGEAAGRMQHLLARIGSGVEKYVRLRLASAVLRDAIERYRQRNQGPVLRRAGQLFAELTSGSFEGLTPDVNDKDEPILLGVRPGGRTVGVGGMSEGTCDQLYLALKLASLEHELDHGAPWPFIIDDILVNFDDDRSLATLRVLADLSRRTQVLFFTHHAHLVELAARHLDPDVLFTHRLDSTGAELATT